MATFVVEDPTNNNKKCEHDSSYRVFDLRGGNAIEQHCREACNKNENCVAFSGIWHRWCIGCSTDLTDSMSGAIAFKKTGRLLPCGVRLKLIVLLLTCYLFAIINIYFYTDCNDNDITDLSNQIVMETKGWVFDVDYSMNIQYHAQCGGDTWYGWSYPGVGSVKIELIGSGQVTLNYGNCHKGDVNVLLNDKVISSAKANVKNVLVSFNFSNGDVLKLT